jgi:hypothetical protein
METDQSHTTILISEMASQLFELATEMLDTANEQMADLVDSGYGVTPQEFHDLALQLTKRRLRSIGLDP